MMMALVADIHSNIHALRKASEVIAESGPDTVVCAGDIVGYGAFPDECCSESMRICSAAVAGNHDRAALSKDFRGMNPYAAAAALWTAERLDDRSRRYLSSLAPSLRLVIGSVRIAVFHGSPADPDEYVEECDATEDMLTENGCDILVLGHTHKPYSRRFGAGLVVNPGSVGQPRDGDPRGSVAFVDTQSMSCETIRFEYPVQEAADSIRSEGLPHVLAERLLIGR